MKIALHLASKLPAGTDPFLLLTTIKKALSETRRFDGISIQKRVPTGYRTLDVALRDFNHRTIGPAYEITLTLRVAPEESWSEVIPANPRDLSSAAEKVALYFADPELYPELAQARGETGDLRHPCHKQLDLAHIYPQALEACRSNDPGELLEVAERYAHVWNATRNFDAVLDATELFALAGKVDRALELAIACMGGFSGDQARSIRDRVGGLRVLKKYGSDVYRFLLWIGRFVETGEGGAKVFHRVMYRLTEAGMPSPAVNYQHTALRDQQAVLMAQLHFTFGRHSASLYKLGSCLNREDLGRSDDFDAATMIETLRSHLVAASHEHAFTKLARAIRADYTNVRLKAASAFLDETFRLCRYLQSPTLHAGENHLEAQELREAVAAFDECLRHQPQSGDAYRGRAQAHHYLGSIDAALTDLSAAIKLDPADSIALTRRGGLYSDVLIDCHKAMQDFERSLRVDPYDHRTLAYRGIARSKFVGDEEGAVADLRLAVYYCPYDAVVRYNLAYLLLHAGRLEEALAEFDIILRQHSDYADAWISRGLCHRRAGNAAQAVSDLSEGYRLNPQLVHALWNRAFALADLKRTDEAVRDAEAYLEYDNTSQLAYEAKALVEELQARQAAR